MSYQHASVVTPSDTVGQNFKALYVGTGGDVVVEVDNGTSSPEIVTYVGVANADWILVQGTKIRATGTTASDIVRHW